MKPGDLVKSAKFQQIGIVVEVFGDLDPANPWVKVLFTHLGRTYQWCKLNSLTKLSKKEGDRNLLLSGAISGSGSL